MMKAWVIESYENGFSGLKQKEISIPEPKENQVLLKISSISLNYRDSIILLGEYEPRYKIGLIPGSDCCGYITKIGKNVKNFKVNDRVLTHFCSHWQFRDEKKQEDQYFLGGPIDGGLAEYMVVDEISIVNAPINYNDNEACTLPVSALTPWYSLISIGNLKKDDWVLIEGTGNVSLYAIQISHSLGAKTIVLTSSKEKEEKVLKLGATHVINYKNSPQWERNIMELTNGQGVDHVVDVVGGDYFNKAIQVSRPQGHIYSIGFLKNPKVDINIYDLIYKRINIHGISVAPRQDFIEMINKMNHLKIKPIIDTVYNFNDAINAFKHVNEGSFGKIVIEINNQLKSSNPLN
ncbi:hypothetical protein ACTFIZ_011301 [Dictyostelium cf. discoideum]